MVKSIINAINLKKSFRNSLIFENLNFSINCGEIVAIVGPSGSGKTTLLRCLIGLELVENGSVFIDDECLVKNGVSCNLETKSKIFSKIGVVFQNYELFPNLNVIKNLLIVKNNKKQALELLTRFDLESKSNSKIFTLSGGQKQRVAIIRALMNNPKILFFDEPTAALDVKNKQEIAKLLTEFANQKFAVVVVTHDMEWVNELNCRIFKLK